MPRKSAEANPKPPPKPRKKAKPDSRTDGSPSDAMTPTTSALEKMLGARKSPTDIKEIAHAFHNRVGGSEGFVQMIMDDYDACPPGSLARTRIQHLLKDLFQIATPKERFGDLALVNDDDLARVWNEQLEKNEKSDLFKKVVTNDPSWVYHYCI